MNRTMCRFVLNSCVVKELTKIRTPRRRKKWADENSLQKI